MSVDNTPRSSPEDNLIAQDNLIDAVELFNTDISQEWCGFPDTVNTSVTTTVTSPPVCVSNSTISSTMNNINISSVASSSHTTHHNSFTDNSRGNFVQDLHVTTSSVSQFTGWHISKMYIIMISACYIELAYSPSTCVLLLMYLAVVDDLIDLLYHFCQLNVWIARPLNMPNVPTGVNYVF